VIVNDSNAANPSTRDVRLDWLRWCCARDMRLIPCWHIDAATGACACGKGVMCGKDAGKHPHVDDWPRVASSDLNQVTAWHQRWPSANWAWVLDRHFVLDVDPRNGGPQPDDVDNFWEQLFGFTLPTTLAQLTGGGGVHLVYDTNGTEVRNGRLWANGKKVPGIDVKGVRGYVMVCPSNHISGRVYIWRNSEQPIAPAPPGLLTMLRARSTSDGTADQDHESVDFDAWLLQEGPNVECGGQREHLLRGIGWMRTRGYTLASTILHAGQVAATYVMCDPEDPWTPEYVAQLVNDVWRRYPMGDRPDAQLIAWAQGIGVDDDVQLPPEVKKRVGLLYVARQAERWSMPSSWRRPAANARSARPARTPRCRSRKPSSRTCSPPSSTSWVVQRRRASRCSRATGRCALRRTGAGAATASFSRATCCGSPAKDCTTSARAGRTTSSGRRRRITSSYWTNPSTWYAATTWTGY
jgi:Bifunctional DNA primase/polymerase, N-terminal